MTVEEIKMNLCYNDIRNPYGYTEREANKDDCYCDNCFRGKTQLAEELLKYIEKFGEKELKINLVY